MCSFSYSYTGYRLAEAADHAGIQRAGYPHGSWTTENEIHKLWSGMVW